MEVKPVIKRPSRLLAAQSRMPAVQSRIDALHDAIRADDLVGVVREVKKLDGDELKAMGTLTLTLSWSAPID